MGGCGGFHRGREFGDVHPIGDRFLDMFEGGIIMACECHTMVLAEVDDGTTIGIRELRMNCTAPDDPLVHLGF